MNSEKLPEDYQSASSIQLTLNPLPGTYKGSQKITISTIPSEEVKLYYGFKPNAGPHETRLYTGPIELKDSSPLVIFAFGSDGTFSPIEIAQYIIEYAQNVALVQEGESLFLLNKENSRVQFTDWKILTNRTSIPLGGITLDAGEKREIGKGFLEGESFLLQDPGGDERSYIVWKYSQVQTKKTSTASNVQTPKKEKIPLNTKPTNIPLPIQENLKNEEVPNPQEQEQEINSLPILPMNETFTGGQTQLSSLPSQELKASATEKSPTSIGIVGGIVLLIAIVGILGRKFSVGKANL